MATRLEQAGADGLVLFNRFMQTDIDPDTFTVSTGFRLSSPAEATLPRVLDRPAARPGALLACRQRPAWNSADDVAAYLLAGADVVMTTSALLRHGPGHVTALLDGLTTWMDRKGIGSVAEIRGLLAPAADTPQPGFGRYGYLSAVEQASRAYSPR